MATGVNKKLTQALPGAVQKVTAPKPTTPAPVVAPKLPAGAHPSFAGYAGDTGPKPGPGYSAAVQGIRDPGFSRSGPSFAGDAGFSRSGPRFAGDPGFSQPRAYAGQPGSVQPAATGLPRSRANTTLDRLNGMTEADPFQFKAPAAFSYDQNTDPAYQAALATARQNIDQSQKDTNAQLRATGQGKSSYSETVANQIGAKEMGRVSTEVLPQLISQAFTRYQDQSNRDADTQRANYGVQRDTTADLSNLYGLQNNEDFSNPLAQSQVTGNFLPGDAKQYMDTIVWLKQQAEAPGVTPEARAQFSAEADRNRAALQNLGFDPAGFGADVNAAGAAGNVTGIRTLAGQGFDADQRNNNLNAALNVGAASGRMITPQTDYTGLFRQAADPNTPLNLQGQGQAFQQGQATDQAAADAQQRQIANLWQIADVTGTIPDALANMYGLPRGMPTQDAMRWAASFTQSDNHYYDGLSQDASQFQDTSDRAWAGLDYDMANPSGSNAPKYAGLSPENLLGSLRSNYSDPDTQAKDAFGSPSGPTIKGGITKDPNKRYQMFLDVLDSGLEGGAAAEDQVLISLGMTKKEISEMESRAAKDNSLPKG